MTTDRRWRSALIVAVLVLALAVIYARWSVSPSTLDGSQTSIEVGALSRDQMTDEMTLHAVQKTDAQSPTVTSPLSDEQRVQSTINEDVSVSDTFSQSRDQIHGVPDANSAGIPALLDESPKEFQFPIPLAIQRECQIGGHLGQDECQEARQMLASMAHEPRDQIWAGALEDKLSDTILAVTPENYEIRAIECRTRTCAVEVAMINTYYHPRFDYYFRKANQLREMSLSAVEIYEPERTVSVVLFVLYSDVR